MATTTTTAPAEKEKKISKKKKVIKQVPHGHVYVQASFNNTIVSITDQTGAVLGWSSAGAVGFKGPKKATPYAAGQVVKKVLETVAACGIKEVNVFIRGIGGGREGAIRGLNANGLTVLSIKDMTPLPHNGCRPPGRRRV